MRLTITRAVSGCFGRKEPAREIETIGRADGDGRKDGGGAGLHRVAASREITLYEDHALARFLQLGHDERRETPGSFALQRAKFEIARLEFGLGFRI